MLLEDKLDSLYCNTEEKNKFMKINLTQNNVYENKQTQIYSFFQLIPLATVFIEHSLCYRYSSRYSSKQIRIKTE